MTGRAKTRIVAYDVAEQLRTPEERAAYLDAWFEAAPDDSAGIARALGDIARARNDPIGKMRASERLRHVARGQSALGAATPGEEPPILPKPQRGGSNAIPCRLLPPLRGLKTFFIFLPGVAASL